MTHHADLYLTLTIIGLWAAAATSLAWLAFRRVSLLEADLDRLAGRLDELGCVVNNNADVLKETTNEVIAEVNGLMAESYCNDQRIARLERTRSRGRGVPWGEIARSRMSTEN
jgi:hypothetical protein